MSRVDDLIAAGFQQTSRKYRLLARTPEGKTPLEALREVDPLGAKHLEELIQQQASQIYRTLHAKGEDSVELSREEFNEYLTKTGRGPLPSEKKD